MQEPSHTNSKSDYRYFQYSRRSILWLITSIVLLWASMISSKLGDLLLQALAIDMGWPCLDDHSCDDKQYPLMSASAA